MRIKNKKYLGIGLAAATAAAATAAVFSTHRKRRLPSSSINRRKTTNTRADIKDVLVEFEALSKIPRKSHNEAAAAEYLCEWAERNNLTFTNDSVGNVIIDKPASIGYENSPRVILQAHMDMVCTAAEDIGFDYNPLTDGIQLIYRSKDGTPCSTGDKPYTLSAKGTSLGADDGIGIAEILYILKRDDIKHPPLRAIFTIDEEDGMEGALSLDERYLDAKYLINIDNEDIDSLCNSCADSTSFTLKKDFNPSEPTGDLAYEISLSNLCGGHSGMEIGLGRANAIFCLAAALKEITSCGISIELRSLCGGFAGNAIPQSAKAVVIIDSDKAQSFKNKFNQIQKRISEAYCYTEPNFSFTCDELDYVPAPIVNSAETSKLLSLLSILPCGVNSISAVCDGLIESSSNIGIIETSEKSCSILFTTRSSVAEHSQRLKLTVKTAAELTGFDVEETGYAPGWTLNPESELVKKYSDAFKAVTGREIKASPIHAGLECGCLARKNPNLDMISVGPTITGLHSPDETLYIDTVSENLNTVIKVLENLK